MLRTLEMHRIEGAPADHRRKEQLWCAAMLPPGVGLLVVDVQTIGSDTVYVQSVVCPALLAELMRFAVTDAVISGMHFVPAARRDGSGRDTPFPVDAVASGNLPNVEGGPILLLRNSKGKWLFRGRTVEPTQIHELTLILDLAAEDERLPWDSSGRRSANAAPRRDGVSGEGHGIDRA